MMQFCKKVYPTAFQDWDLIPINQVPAPKGWPAARDYHTAHSLWDPDDPDLQHPAIVVLCGMDNSSKSRSDAWVFDVEFKLWEKVGTTSVSGVL